MRPAVEVWKQAVDAFLRSARPVAGDPEIASVDYDVAAAIIEQDRAALVAEIVAWLREDAPQWGHEALAEEIEAKWGKP